MAFFWLVTFVVLVLIEICTVNLVSIWFASGALFTFIVSMISDNIVIQASVFIFISVISLIVTKPFVRKIKVNHIKTNLDRVIGMDGVVTQNISELEIGEVKVDGKRWSAKSDCSINIGEVVEIQKIEGVKLIVKKKEN